MSTHFTLATDEHGRIVGQEAIASLIALLREHGITSTAGAGDALPEGSVPNLTGPGEPSKPETTGGIITGDEPYGTIYTNNEPEKYNFQAFVWRKQAQVSSDYSSAVPTWVIVSLPQMTLPLDDATVKIRLNEEEVGDAFISFAWDVAFSRDRLMISIYGSFDGVAPKPAGQLIQLGVYHDLFSDAFPQAMGIDFTDGSWPPPEKAKWTGAEIGARVDVGPGVYDLDTFEQRRGLTIQFTTPAELGSGSFWSFYAEIPAEQMALPLPRATEPPTDPEPSTEL